VTRRVGVRVNPFVGVIDTVGAGLVRSTVGVSVGVSRVGIGACVGVEINVPFGKLMKVGTTGVEVRTSVGVGGVNTVGVAGRTLSDGRTYILNNPAQ